MVRTLGIYALVATAVVMCLAAAPRHARRPDHVIDLTHTLSPAFPYIPVPGITFPFAMTPIATLEKNGVAANRWDIHEHIGTQIDAPNHFVAGGLGVDRLPVRSLVVPLVVIDISSRARGDADAEVTPADIAAWEKQHGRLPEDAAVLMHSGWDARVGNPTAFLNVDATNTMHFPGFSPATVDFLAKERRVAGIGVDTISLDPGRDKTYASHRLWLATGKWAVEAVASLNAVPPVGATLFVGAAKVQNATGGPVRLLAVW